MKVLAVGDLHLGRRPSRLPGAVERRYQVQDVGPAEAWERTVKFALAEPVHAVVLAGDVVEQEDDFFEAYSALRSGITRLVDSGIRVLGVAGNHDVRVLPRLAEELQDFELLGRDGQWERTELGSEGIELVFWGWSFPQQRVTESPLAAVTLGRDRRPTLGVLHADRDATGSVYAPIRSRELAGAGLDGWLLGHIHQPDQLTAANPSGYLGSVTALDPGERGPHGPWLIEIGTTGVRQVSQLLLAPLRWEEISVDLTGIGEAEEAHHRVLAALRDLDERLAGLRFRPDLVGVRLELVGRSGLRREVESRIREADLGAPREYTDSGIAYFVLDSQLDLKPEIDLEALTRSADPVGLLARRILALSADPEDPDRRSLVAEGRRALEAAARGVGAEALGEPMLDDGAVADALARGGFEALALLLEQREGES